VITLNIDIIISADDIKLEKVKNKTVLIIDVLRATSVIITAISNGCSSVIPVVTVEEAFEVAQKDRGNCIILGGERRALKIDGFDCSNSPLEYTKEVIGGKTLVISTTNGTRAIRGSIGAKTILIGALINAKAAAKKIINIGDDLVIVNAGTYGQFSIDDFICSGYIIDCILKQTNAVISDIAKTAQYIYSENTDINGFVKFARHYNVMKKLNLEKDIEYCLKKDIVRVVPEYKDGKIEHPLKEAL
jgi:2-phosphosulfolactate phosphatase